MVNWYHCWLYGLLTELSMNKVRNFVRFSAFLSWRGERDNRTFFSDKQKEISERLFMTGESKPWKLRKLFTMIEKTPQSWQIALKWWSILEWTCCVDILVNDALDFQVLLIHLKLKPTLVVILINFSDQFFFSSGPSKTEKPHFFKFDWR